MIKTQAEIDAWFLSMANLIAHKYGMKLEIDPVNNIINFTGNYDYETEVKCAMEIDNILGV